MPLLETEEMQRNRLGCVMSESCHNTQGGVNCALGHRGHPAEPQGQPEWRPALLGLMRPFGIVLGYRGDKRGKKKQTLRQVWLNLKINNKFPKG